MVLSSIAILSVMYNSFKSDVLMVSISMFMMKILLMNGELNFVFFYMDMISYMMIIMTCWIVMVIVMISVDSAEIIKLICLNTFIVIMFFSVNNMLVFFLVFEFSLIPIYLLTVGFGNQPERLKAGRWMMLYTISASIPLFFFVMSSMNQNFFWFISYFYLESEHHYFKNDFILVAMILAMLIKAPLFIFHSWLPKAHVESPLQGSMILAGIMLKMGIFGIIRFLMAMPSFNKSSVGLLILSISMMGSMYSCWMAMNSDDVKMTVAYSSVSHMNFLISTMISMKMYMIYSSFIVMVSHGLCSCMLFYIMTEMYMNSHSRSIILMKGFNSTIPILNLFSFLNWAANMSAPPSVAFIGEIMGIHCILSVSFIGLLVSIMYIFLNSIYSMFNFSIQCHSFSKLNSKYKNVSILMMISFFWMIFPLFMMFFILDFLFFF